MLRSIIKAHRYRLALAWALLLLAGPSPAALSDAEFYLPPDPLPDTAPGDVIRFRPAWAGPPSARALADAWQLMYRSTDALGRPVAVTGTVLVPKKGVDADTPIVGFAPGTQGPAFRCAASRMIDKGAFYEQPAINDMLEAGYAVAVTDYEGYHPQPETTYMVGASMGAALLDVVRAAMRLPDARLSANAPVVLRGYSQGGGAVMWAGEMQLRYAPDMNLRGVAGGGVPANLARVALPLDGREGFGVMFYALVGQDHAYPELSLASFLNASGQSAVSEMQADMCVLRILQSFAGDRLDDYTDANPLNSERLQRIDENTLGRRAIPVPVFLYHEQRDGLVAYDQAESLRDDYCGLGSDVRWRSWDTGGRNGVIRHINLVYRANQAVADFIAARLAGEPAHSSCFE